MQTLRYRFLSSALFIVLFSSLASAAQNDSENTPERSETDLPVCTGFLPDRKDWERLQLIPGAYADIRCPEGHAIWAAHSPPGEFMKNAETAPLAGICCPLPKGVLGEDFMFVASECPETYVVTGARVPKMIFSPITNDVHVSWQQTWKYLRCTRINTARYRLGPPRKALFVDWGSHFSNVFAERTTLGRIPAAFRYAVMRRDRSNWLVQDCVGYPWGSLMSAKLGGRCNFRFRQLQYAGATEDPPAGTPVQLYPDCRTISSPFEENARCLQ